MEREAREDTWPVGAGMRLLGGDVCTCVLYIFVRIHVRVCLVDLLALSCCQSSAVRGVEPDKVLGPQTQITFQKESKL